MDSSPLHFRDDGALRSAAIKAVRRHRGMSTQEVATAMNMPLRTYEHFEAGQGRLNLDYVHRFGRVTDSDPYGLFMAVAIGSPEFAMRVADNKMMTIFAILLQAGDRRFGDRIRKVDARTLIAVFNEMFDRLDEAGAAVAEAEAFLQDGLGDLASRRPRPGR